MDNAHIDRAAKLTPTIGTRLAAAPCPMCCYAAMMVKTMHYKAYLIVICDNVTNAILSATIWSSPEWEQSRCLDQRTYVAYATSGPSYAEAKEGIVRAMEHPQSRYHWLLNHLDERSKPVPSA
jgi:hypothetical protein